MEPWPADSIWAPAAVGAVFGLVIGSFLNVVIHRLPRMLEREWRSECRDLLGLESERPDESLTLASPGSRCPACHAAIRPWHNIPVLGYLWLRGRCADCHSPIGLRYPAVELLTGVAIALVAARFGLTAEAVAAALLTGSLIALAAIDLDHRLLPDRITLPLLWLGLLLSLSGLFATPTDAIIGAAAGYGALWIVFQGFRLATGKEGMGFGDFKLLAVFGAWLGWQALPLIVLIASFAGILIGGGYLLLSGQGRSQPLPFGPFLAVAGWIALMWGEAINRFYLQLSGLA